MRVVTGNAQLEVDNAVNYVVGFRGLASERASLNALRGPTLFADGVSDSKIKHNILHNLVKYRLYKGEGETVHMKLKELRGNDGRYNVYHMI